MFDTERFVDDCKSALAEDNTEKAMREVLARALSAPGDVLKSLGEPDEAGFLKLHQSDELTSLNVVWAPLMTLMPHNHNMWAVIGVYGGREDNIFWRRCKDDPLGRVEAAGAKSLGPHDVRPLGADIIHSVTNPTSKFTGAIHIYGGDFFAVERSEWDPENLEEHRYDLEKNLKIFEDANMNLG